MTSITIDGIEGQLEKRVNNDGNVNVAEWKGRDVIVLLKPRTYGQFDNAELQARVFDTTREFTKDDLLLEIEKELHLDADLTGYNDTDGTIDKTALSTILLGIRRLKENSIPRSDD